MWIIGHSENKSVIEFLPFRHAKFIQSSTQSEAHV